MPEEDIICQIEVIDLARPGQVSSSVQVSSSELTTYDLQLQKVITSPSELRFEYSLTLWKSHCVKNPLICLRRILDVRPRCYMELVQVRSARQSRLARLS